MVKLKQNDKSNILWYSTYDVSQLSHSYSTSPHLSRPKWRLTSGKLAWIDRPLEENTFVYTLKESGPDSTKSRQNNEALARVF